MSFAVTVELHCNGKNLKFQINKFFLKFQSEILASLNVDKNKMLSPGLKNNRTLKCCYGNFPTKSYMSRLLEKYQINI